MSAFRSTLHSLVLSPDLQLLSWITILQKLTFQRPSSTVWSMRWSERGLFHPVSHPASFRFPISDYVGFLFIRWIRCSDLWSFKISDAVIHHFSLCTQLRNIFNCNWLMELRLNVSGGMYLPFFFFLSVLWLPVGMSEKCGRDRRLSAFLIWSCETALWSSLLTESPLRLSDHSKLSPLASELI